MQYGILGKFELGIYDAKTKIFTGGSFRTTITLDREISSSAKNKIEFLIDTLDHTTLVSESSPNVEFIKKNSARHIIIKDGVDFNSSIVAKLLIAKTYEVLLELGEQAKVISVNTTIDFDSETITVFFNDLGIEELSLLLKTEYSSDIFTT